MKGRFLQGGGTAENSVRVGHPGMFLLERALWIVSLVA